MDGFLVPEEGEGGEDLDPVGLSQFLVGHLDEVYPEAIGVIVNVLQLGQHFVTILTALLVCGRKHGVTHVVRLIKLT